MRGRDILAKVDHTLLKPTATEAAIFELAEEAVEFGTASVCVPPTFVKPLKLNYGPALTVCTVIGFPLGYMTTNAKVAEAADALADGADELDMVINRGFVKDGDYRAVTEEIFRIKQLCGDRILKVIVEVCDLTDEEIIECCHCVTAAGADFIKTSTGFGSSGATPHAVQLFKENIGPNVRIKAAGGIRTIEDLVTYINLGCDRIGASAAVGLLRNRLEEDLCE